jgi:hypothetical protein
METTTITTAASILRDAIYAQLPMLHRSLITPQQIKLGGVLPSSFHMTTCSYCEHQWIALRSDMKQVRIGDMSYECNNTSLYITEEHFLLIYLTYYRGSVSVTVYKAPDWKSIMKADELRWKEWLSK